MRLSGVVVLLATLIVWLACAGTQQGIAQGKDQPHPGFPHFRTLANPLLSTMFAMALCWGYGSAVAPYLVLTCEASERET